MPGVKITALILPKLQSLPVTVTRFFGVTEQDMNPGQIVQSDAAALKSERASAFTLMFVKCNLALA